MNTNINREETLRLVYPLFKREVYDRREAIMRLTRFGGAILVGFTVLVSSPVLALAGRGLMKLLLAGVVATFALGLIHQIHQHKVRHAQAKQGLIEVEAALGLFDEGAYLPGRPLYPATWRSPPVGDRSAAMSTLLVLVLAALAAVTVLLA